jgi:hypothetical protein
MAETDAKSEDTIYFPIVSGDVDGKETILTPQIASEIGMIVAR